MTTWRSISTAPLAKDVELQVGDRFGDHVLSFPCRLTDTGWINSELNVALSPSVMPLAWRPWKKQKLADVRRSPAKRAASSTPSE